MVTESFLFWEAVWPQVRDMRWTHRNRPKLNQRPKPQRRRQIHTQRRIHRTRERMSSRGQNPRSGEAAVIRQRKKLGAAERR
jgi:hypothetical protein